MGVLIGSQAEDDTTWHTGLWKHTLYVFPRRFGSASIVQRAASVVYRFVGFDRTDCSTYRLRPSGTI